MKDKPIIMSSESVRAIIEGRKVQTRRVIKPQPEFGVCECLYSPTGFSGTYEDGSCGCSGKALRPPYQFGQKLWVRESFAEHTYFSGTGISQSAIYKDTLHQLPNGSYWQSPIFMPRWASRITLEVIGIQAQRVQDITPGDYRKEGIGISFPADISSLDVEHIYKERWISLWESLNAKRGYSWKSNPWVWVIDFKVVADA